MRKHIPRKIIRKIMYTTMQKHINDETPTIFDIITAEDRLPRHTKISNEDLKRLRGEWYKTVKKHFLEQLHLQKRTTEKENKRYITKIQRRVTRGMIKTRRDKRKIKEALNRKIKSPTNNTPTGRSSVIKKLSSGKISKQTKLICEKIARVRGVAKPDGGAAGRNDVHARAAEQATRDAIHEHNRVSDSESIERM